MLAQAVNQTRAEHKVAHSTGGGAGRAAQAAGQHAAHGGAGAEMRWLKSQVLVRCCQRALQFAQRRSGQNRNHQFAGFVIDDAAQGAGIDHLAPQTRTQKVFAAGPAHAQNRLVLRSGGSADAL